MNTAVLPDVDLDALLDEQLPCEAVIKPGDMRCTDLAEWSLRSLCSCGHRASDLLCTLHKDMVVAFERDPAIEFTCNVCGGHDVRLTEVRAL